MAAKLCYCQNMNMKKTWITLAFCGAVLIGGFFAVKYFANSKKIISIGNLENRGQQIETNSSEVVIPDNDKKAAPVEQQIPIKENETKDAINVQPTPSTVNNNKSISTDKEKNAVSGSGKIVSKLVSWGFAKSSDRNIKAVIVHTSYNNLGGDVFDFDKVLQEWKDAGVAPHYAIDRDGTIYQLVADQNIAWHGGVSKLPDGTTDVNGVSIGIEVINSQDAKFADAQYGALNSLIATLKKKYAIKYILGHDEIAPGRKTDPWGIDWKKVQK